MVRKKAVPSVKNQTTYDSTYTVEKTARDDGAGGWVGHVGTVDYNTGVFTLRVRGDYQYVEYTYQATHRFSIALPS